MCGTLRLVRHFQRLETMHLSAIDHKKTEIFLSDIRNGTILKNYDYRQRKSENRSCEVNLPVCMD